MNFENERAAVLTKFLCQELLFEFVTGRLEPGRQAAMDEFLDQDRESQRELERLKRGLRYSAQGAHVEIRPELRAALTEFEPHWKKTLARWTLESSQRWWKVLPYVVLVLVLGLGIVVMKPWKIERRKDILLAEDAKPTPPPTSPAPIGEETPSVESMTANAPPVPASTGSETSSASAASLPAVPADTPSDESVDVDLKDFAGGAPKVRAKILALGGKAIEGALTDPAAGTSLIQYKFYLPRAQRPALLGYLRGLGIVTSPPSAGDQDPVRIVLTVRTLTTSSPEEVTGDQESSSD